MTKGSHLLRNIEASIIAASIIYFARKNILQSDEIIKLVKVPCIWPQEIIFLTRCREDQIFKMIDQSTESKIDKVDARVPTISAFTAKTKLLKAPEERRGSFKRPQINYEKMLSKSTEI